MRTLYLLLLTTLLSLNVIAQCEMCTPDESCVAEGDFPVVCPEFMPFATTGVYYSEFMTFNMPSQVTDPESGISATLLEVVITNVQGMPFGMEFTMDNPDNTYHPSEGENFGCSTVCGTPLLAGDYEVVITAHVTAEAFGFETEVDQNFISPFTVVQGEGGNSSFTYNNIAGCGTLEIDFEALINAAPQPTTYNWDFGNGNFSTEQFPPTQTYSADGEHIITLETTIWDYVLTDVLVSDVADGWSGDIEEPTTLQNPDPYFVITDGGGNSIYTSATIDGETSGNWSNINLILNNPPYTINFWDEDLFSADDALGSWQLPSESGNVIFNAGGTVGSINIALQAGDIFNDEQAVNVFPLPNANFEVYEEIHVLSYNDSTLSTFVWYLDGDTLLNETSSEIITTSWGTYDCFVTNIYGCSGWSEPYVQCPEFTPEFDSETGTFNAPGGFETYQWYYNGLAVDGAVTSFIVATEPGNYAVEITTDYGCEVLSDAYILTHINGIPGLTKFNIFPNPSDGHIQLEIGTTQSRVFNVQVVDYTGRICWENGFSVFGNQTKSLDLSQLSSGIYLVQLNTLEGFTSKRIIIR